MHFYRLAGALGLLPVRMAHDISVVAKRDEDLCEPHIPRRLHQHGVELRAHVEHAGPVARLVGTAELAVNQLYREMKAMMQDSAVRASLAKVGLEPVASVGSPAEFTQFLKASNEAWGKTVREANIRLELK